MNFNYLIPLFLILASSCGVKAPPHKFPDTAVDSYIQEYTGDDSHIKKDENETGN